MPHPWALSKKVVVAAGVPVSSIVASMTGRHRSSSTCVMAASVVVASAVVPHVVLAAVIAACVVAALLSSRVPLLKLFY